MGSLRYSSGLSNGTRTLPTGNFSSNKSVAGRNGPIRLWVSTISRLLHTPDEWTSSVRSVRSLIRSADDGCHACLCRFCSQTKAWTKTKPCNGTIDCKVSKSDGSPEKKKVSLTPEGGKKKKKKTAHRCSAQLCIADAHYLYASRLTPKQR